MGKRIRPTTVQSRPAHTRGRRRAIWVIASGGEVFILKRLKGALVRVPASEADFGARPAAAANDPLLDHPDAQ
ncbi:MAG: hypothetical protein MUC79_15020 [Thiobacillaceae bacterium]|nr:hypothetical protein [Thiobacillaceae bacterium]